jgi:O-antigen ligase
VTEQRASLAWLPARTWATPSLGLAVAAFLLPLAGALAPLAIAPLLLVSALLVLALGGHRRLGRLIALRALLAVLGLVCLWATASALWSILPAHSLLEGLRLFAIVASGLILVAEVLGLDALERERVSRALISGFLLALALLAVVALARLALPLPSPGTATARWLRGYTRFDRGATTLALALWPVLLVVGRSGMLWRGIALTGATAVVVLGLPSRAAMLSLLVGMVLLPLGVRMPRLVAGAIGAGVVAIGFAFAVLPLNGAIISRIHEGFPWLHDSALHRLAIWQFGMDRIAERPVLGWGLDAAREIPGGSVLIDDPSLPGQLIGFGQWMPLHPHSAVLQWRLELGIPGAILCTLVVLWLVARIAGSTSVSPRSRAIGLSLTASALVVVLVSYGFWQAWWQSSLWLLAALMLAALPAEESGSARETAGTPA